MSTAFNGAAVRVSELLLESMTLAAIEAYHLGEGQVNEVGLETLGYIWGYQKDNVEDKIFYADRMSLSLSAQRTNNSVKPNPEAARLKNDLVTRWSPHVRLLGDFHSHPYEDLNEVKANQGFEFSEGDFHYFLQDDFVWEESGGYPLMMVMTICKLQRVRESGGGNWVRNNVWQFDIGQFRCWLNAAVGYVDDHGKRMCSNNKHSSVFLELNTGFFNEGGDRIGG